MRSPRDYSAGRSPTSRNTCSAPLYYGRKIVLSHFHLNLLFEAFRIILLKHYAARLRKNMASNAGSSAFSVEGKTAVVTGAGCGESRVTLSPYPKLTRPRH